MKILEVIRKHYLKYGRQEGRHPNLENIEEDKFIVETERADKKYKKLIDEKISFLNNQKPFPLFKYVEIETMNRCNGLCSFCPVNRKADKREFKKMDEKLFTSIIEQLKKLDYDGYIGLYSNNEPLMDRRIFDFVKYAKESLPNAFHYLITNGTLLNIEKYDTLMKYLNRIIIDNYSDDGQLIKPVKEVSEYIEDKSELMDHTDIANRKMTEVLSSRAGQANNRKKVTILASSCLLPFQQLIVRPDGKISLCCNDALGEFTMGDLTKESLTEIWYGKSYTKIRKKLTVSRQEISLCKNCDFLCMEISEYVDDNPELRDRTVIENRKMTQVLSSRAGRAIMEKR